MSAAFGQPRKHPETHTPFLGEAQFMVASTRQCLANLATNLMPGRSKLTPSTVTCLATQITVFIHRSMYSYFEHNLDDYIYVNILTYTFTHHWITNPLTHLATSSTEGAKNTGKGQRGVPGR